MAQATAAMHGAKWRIRRLHNILPKCSAKYFAVKNACDVIRSVRSYPAKYYFAAEQASGHVAAWERFRIRLPGPATVYTNIRC